MIVFMKCKMKLIMLFVSRNAFSPGDAKLFTLRKIVRMFNAWERIRTRYHQPNIYLPEMDRDIMAVYNKCQDILYNLCNFNYFPFARLLKYRFQWCSSQWSNIHRKCYLLCTEFCRMLSVLRARCHCSYFTKCAQSFWSLLHSCSPFGKNFLLACFFADVLFRSWLFLRRFNSRSTSTITTVW